MRGGLRCGGRTADIDIRGVYAEEDAQTPANEAMWTW